MLNIRYAHQDMERLCIMFCYNITVAAIFYFQVHVVNRSLLNRPIPNFILTKYINQTDLFFTLLLGISYLEPPQRKGGSI